MATRRLRAAIVGVFGASSAVGCGGADSASGDGDAEAPVLDASGDGGLDARGDVRPPADVLADVRADVLADAVGPDGAPPPCTTKVSYGDAWIHDSSHPDTFDVTTGKVTWDGVCKDDGANGYALLSNGWKPYFNGHGACVLALDESCGAAEPCTTRVTYGPSWFHGAGHPAQFDDVDGRVTWDRLCHDAGATSSATLSNGWTPTFSGAGACELSLEYRGCGGLYQNPVVDVDCPDPGVLVDGARYVMSCTSGGAANAFPLRTSTDLVSWKSVGFVFPAGTHPTWATGDFWAPEIHRVGSKYVAYFSARGADGKLSIGAASGSTALGPFVDRGSPLVHDAAMGLIDVSEFEAADGTRYLLWKEDGNAVGKPTPIHVQTLAADGLSLIGSPVTAITNDRAWEGGLVEGPWMIAHGGSTYLFYSANGYASTAYAIGVARAASPLGPFTKLAAPILVTGGAWAGPGHCSVVDLPDGETEIVYHAWRAGKVGAAPGRLTLVDRVVWSGGWPSVPGAPSDHSLPMP